MRPTRRALLGGFAGGLTALAGCGYRPAGGERRWSRPVEGFVSADDVLFDAGRLLVVVRETRAFDFEAEEWYEGGQLTVVDPVRGESTGREEFREPLSTVACTDDTVYAALADGSVHTVPTGGDTRQSEPDPDGGATASPGEGTSEWAMTTEVAPSGATTLAAGDRVYVGADGGVAALEPANGATAWRWTGGSARTVVPGRGATGTAAYAVTDGEVLALDSDGAVRWTRRASSDGAPVVGEEGIYLADGERLVALTHDGRERWARAVGESLGDPVLSGERLYHVSVDGVRSFSPGGRERWRTGVPPGVVSGVAADNGRVFLRYADALAGVGSEGVAWRADLAREFDPVFGPFAAGEVVVLAGESELRGYWQSQLPRDGGLL